MRNYLYIFPLLFIALAADPAFGLNGINLEEFRPSRFKDSDSLNNLPRIEKHIESIYYQGDYNQVIQQTDSILSQTRAKNKIDSTSIAKLYYHRFESFYRLGKKESSIEAANKGLSICPDNNESKNLRAILYYKRAYSEKDLNFPLRSRQSMMLSVEQLESHLEPDLDYLIGAYMFLSSHEAYHGNLEEAQRYLRLAERSYHRDKLAVDKAREGPNGENDRYEVMLPYRKVYLLYSLGETKKDSLAIEKELEKLLNLSNQEEFSIKYESIYVTQALNHSANWFINKSETEQNTSKYEERALVFVNQAINLIEKRNFSGYLTSLNFLRAKALTNAANYNEAGKLVDKLLDDLPPNSGNRPYFLAQKGLIEAKQQQKQLAIKQFRKSIGLVHRAEEPLNEDFSNFEPSTSFGAVRLAIKIAQKLRENFPDDPEVTKLTVNLYEVALSQFENSMLNSKFSPSYDVLLRQILNGLLSQYNNNNDSGSEELSELLKTTEVLKNQLEWKRFNQSRLTNKLSDLDSVKAKGLELRKQLVTANELEDVLLQDSLKILLKQNENTIFNRYPNLGLLDASDFQLTKLQENLTEDSIVLKFIILEDELSVFIITKKAISVELTPWDDEQRIILDNFVAELKNQNYQVELAKDLGDLFLSRAQGYSNVIINPDSELFKLPFETLIVNDQLALEAYNIRYTSNLGFIDPEIVKPKAITKLAIYVPDYNNTFVSATNRTQLGLLVGAQKEAYAISQYFTSSIYDRENLTKEVFFETAANANLLHLAMHSQVNNDKPELSRLLFSQNNSEDNDLYLEEIYGLDLSAELVVLSACNTGIGRENAGKSLESFQRAFTFAGVPAAVASLWEVPDLATQDIMTFFYKNLKKGQSKSVALKNAKSTFKTQHKGSKLDQPYYWAGFVLYGADDPVAESNSIFYWLLIALGVVFALLLWIRNKKAFR